MMMRNYSLFEFQCTYDFRHTKTDWYGVAYTTREHTLTFELVVAPNRIMAQAHIDQKFASDLYENVETKIINVRSPAPDLVLVHTH